MKIVILGSGTSHGIPCIACSCAVCSSTDKRDKRTRCSAYITNENSNGTKSHILIDIGPEFRIQALENKITAIDAVLLTHSHADHLHGLDDIRVFSHTISSSHLKDSSKGNETKGPGIAIYSNKNTLDDVKYRFDYVFKETQIGGGKPKLRLEAQDIFENKMPSEFGDINVTPIPMKHGELETTGWLLTIKDNGEKRSFAYLTDCSYISDDSVKKIIENGGVIEHCVIDGLREEPHETHFSYLQAMEIAERIKSRHTWFTHICHLKSHVQIQEYIDKHLYKFPFLSEIAKNGGSVEPAYDGLMLEV